jgi:hypothetical protein
MIVYDVNFFGLEDWAWCLTRFRSSTNKRNTVCDKNDGFTVYMPTWNNCQISFTFPPATTLMIIESVGNLKKIDWSLINNFFRQAIRLWLYWLSFSGTGVSWRWALSLNRICVFITLARRNYPVTVLHPRQRARARKLSQSNSQIASEKRRQDRHTTAPPSHIIKFATWKQSERPKISFSRGPWTKSLSVYNFGRSSNAQDSL